MGLSVRYFVGEDDVALPRADRAQRHHLGAAVLRRVRHGDGLLVDIETDVQALARLFHG
jgi:hypothetical protein